MQPFHRLTAPACPLPYANIDTDQLIPARFMKRSRAEGYGGYLLHDMRFSEDGTDIADFPLNKPIYRNSQIIVARRNFGAGSSREAAVYALADYGIRCVIAPSFGDIFASNAVNNGLLPARVDERDAEALIKLLETHTELTIDLEEQTISAKAMSAPFAIDPVWRTKLLNGWDDIDITLSQADAIEQFREQDSLRRPWATPRVLAR
ncbi:3-isopropylmalate/(R)-2-methylmalate dehydratase small subunit [Microvirga lupini]|uniref:3-isopropylmalate dehydratase small subunit n=1 Tax=Microvirga lupini TaxID=420324 RepID=A0A7W4YVW9_9HYPH|nr:3-isopropylmalate dehydratase small subunit [Microvirga lupini]MBB3017423.1 3-isopropylmalate/(R)-2-methylmalate dehydratase small subunit [Microvirga lupini]